MGANNDRCKECIHTHSSNPTPSFTASLPGSVSGKLAAGGTSWVPSAYVAAQQDAVRAFFQQNGYIGYDTVRWLTAGLLCSQRLPLV